MTWRQRLLNLLRVPHEPSPPDGDHDVRVFRAAPNYFRYRLVGWALGNVAGLIGLWFAVGFGLTFLPPFIPARVSFLGITLTKPVMLVLLHLLEAGALGLFFLQAFAALLLLKLDFEQRWYIVSDRSLRIREGLVRMHEKTMTFANVQHVAIRQGPLQRLLRIADLEVRTAGGGRKAGDDGEQHAGSDLHVAYFRGIANAEGVRDTIRERLRLHRDAGLGDPDDTGHHSPPVELLPAQVDLLPLARALAAEARALREAV
jgi:hypothetical protein